MAIQVAKLDIGISLEKTNQYIKEISDRIISITPYKSFLIVIYDDSDPVETPLVNRRIR